MVPSQHHLKQRPCQCAHFVGSFAKISFWGVLLLSPFNATQCLQYSMGIEPKKANRRRGKGIETGRMCEIGGDPLHAAALKGRAELA